MSAPTTNAEWRAYATSDDPSIERLTLPEIKKLTPAEKLAYDTKRSAYLDAPIVLATPDVDAVAHEVQILAQWGTATTSVTARRGFAISGASGLGKSTIAMHVARHHHQREMARNPVAGPNFQPSAYFRVPPGATPKTLMQSMATSLGLITGPREPADSIRLKVSDVLRTLSTSLIVMDEFHELTSNRTHGVAAASTMKQFAESFDALFIYAGIDLAEGPLLNDLIGRQLAARLKHLALKPLPFGNSDQQALWESLVAGFEEIIPLGALQEGSLVEHAAYLHARTGGSIGSLRSILSDATRTAILNETENITYKLLDATRLDVTAEAQYAAQTAKRRKAAPVEKRQAS